MARRYRRVDRFLWAFGYRSEDRAFDRLDDAFASGEVMPGERPEVVAYRIPSGGVRWGIEVDIA